MLVEANTENLQLAEVEGDALFFYKEGEIPSMEKLLAQVETMFTAFYSHLKLIEKNRVCPCNACSSAANLQLKIIAHCGELEFITVQGKRKPFGTQVIEVHRLMKNSVKSDNYVLFSDDLAKAIHLPTNYTSKLYEFKEGENVYDGKNVNYLFSIIDKQELKLKPFTYAKNIALDQQPTFNLVNEFPVATSELLEYITNYSYRHKWVEGIDRFEFNKNEVTRVGSEHVCVINGKHLNFVTVTKDGEPNQLIYGELTTNPLPVDALYQFYIITPLTHNTCKLDLEIYLMAKSPLKKLLIFLVVKKAFKKNISGSLDKLLEFVSNPT